MPHKVLSLLKAFFIESPPEKKRLISKPIEVPYKYHKQGDYHKWLMFAPKGDYSELSKK